MPLVIVTGMACSGKSSVSRKLEMILKNDYNKSVYVVSEDEVIKSKGLNKDEVYSSAQMEKEIRGILKAEALRELSADQVVIVDAMNSIKGFRYELYCAAKSCKTTHCLVHCVPNSHQFSIEGVYSKEVADKLALRYEAPNSMVRWDNPLFTVHPCHELPLQEIYAALFRRQPQPPNDSTQSQPVMGTDFLYNVDRVTEAITEAVAAACRAGMEGEIVLPGCQLSLVVTERQGPARLAVLRRQFISYVKSHPPTPSEDVATLFVQYLQSHQL